MYVLLFLASGNSILTVPFFRIMGMHAAFAVIARDPNDKVIELNYGRIKVGSALALKAWAIRVACSTAARMHEDFPGNFRIRACTILLSNPPLAFYLLRFVTLFIWIQLCNYLLDNQKKKE